jgi:hypothetical protein
MHVFVIADRRLIIWGIVGEMEQWALSSWVWNTDYSVLDVAGF